MPKRLFSRFPEFVDTLYIGVFRTVSDIYDATFCEKSILQLWVREWLASQPGFAYSKSTMQTPEKCVKNVQIQQ